MQKKLQSDSKNFIVKSNSLIEARYRLSLQESQVILWLLTQIKSCDEDFKVHKLRIADFAKLVNVNVDSKYRELRNITRQLMQRVMEIKDVENNRIIQVSWLSSAIYEVQKGCISLEFSPQLKPYLLQLKSHFTKIDVADTLRMKSTYAIRLFELLLQYITIGSRETTISDLRMYCGIQQSEYQNYFDIKRYVIEKIKSEINLKTEYIVDYTEIKESRKVVAIKWIINKKDMNEQKYLDRLRIIQKEMRSEQIIINSLLEYGFGKITAKRLITVHGEEVVKNAIRAVDLQIQGGKAKNPKAMLRTAILEKWHPEIYKNRKTRI